MKIADIPAFTRRPALYTPGTATMWTDKYISEQLLQVHLNPNLDLASRRPESIERTLAWIQAHTGGNACRILDLGCGPGLYAERLARAGHAVTGVDFSETSIRYARESAERQSLPIEYIHASYLDHDFGEDVYDMVILIYADYGVLTPGDRSVLLTAIRKALKPGGKMLFDVLNGNDPACRAESQTWDAQPDGFWRPGPYLALSQAFYYNDTNVLLHQHSVIVDGEAPAVYRFWTHFFSHALLEQELREGGFSGTEFREDVLPEGGPWSGANVMFCAAGIG